MAYYQGKRPVSDYLDDFLNLVEDSGYTDLKTTSSAAVLTGRFQLHLTDCWMLIQMPGSALQSRWSKTLLQKHPLVVPLLQMKTSALLLFQKKYAMFLLLMTLLHPLLPK